jgi:hypothetical protein
VRTIAFAFAVCFLGACAIHVSDLLTHGWLPYRFAPLPFNIYWTSLTLLDALAAIVLLYHLRVGLAFALVIITSDVALNLFGRFELGLHLNSLALSLQFVFLVLVIVTTCHVFIKRQSSSVTPKMK